MLVLGIETTCDETAAAVVQEGKQILSQCIDSQIALHRPYGGVFPELASRTHVDKLPYVVQTTLQEAHLSLHDMHLISVAKGPGLIGPLLIGLAYAKALSWGTGIPFVGVNHVEAHLYAAMMTSSPALFPALGVVISGGHTFLALIHDIGRYDMISTTVDDAIGEAFDKVAKILNLPYPGGPEIERLASTVPYKDTFSFKPGVVKGKLLHFSFSGLKTQVLYAVRGQNGTNSPQCSLSQEDKALLAASFQEVALNDIISKALLAAQIYACQAIYIGGGVSCNKRLRELFTQQCSLPLFFPPHGLSLDNAAMIGGLGFHVYHQRGYQGDALSLEPSTRIPLSKETA